MGRPISQVMDCRENGLTYFTGEGLQGEWADLFYMWGTAEKTGRLIAQVRDCCAHRHQTSVGPHSAFKALSHSNPQQRTYPYCYCLYCYCCYCYPDERPPISQDLPSLKKKIVSFIFPHKWIPNQRLHLFSEYFCSIFREVATPWSEELLFLITFI